MDTFVLFMFVEKRKLGKSVKYYLVHSYREKGIVKKIRRYLGLNLSDKNLKEAIIDVKTRITSEISELSTKIFDFSISKQEITKLDNFNEKIKICHFKVDEWKKFTERFTYNTNAIEGSTIKLNEVSVILNNKLVNGNEEIETKGVANAVDFIKETKEELSLSLIRKLHKLCFNGSKSFAGEFKEVEVVIRDGFGNIVHSGVPVPQLDVALKDLVIWYKENKNKFKPLILAAIIHNQFEHIHPFQDGNGRVGRLLLNYVLIRKCYPPINISLEDREKYYLSLQRYSNNHNLKPTLHFLVGQYKKTLRQVTTKKRK